MRFLGCEERDLKIIIMNKEFIHLILILDLGLGLSNSEKMKKTRIRSRSRIRVKFAYFFVGLGLLFSSPVRDGLIIAHSVATAWQAVGKMM